MCIQAKDERNGPFPFKRQPKFWAYLSHQVDIGTVRASKMVYDEIMKIDDELKQWFQDREDRGLSIHPTPEVYECVTKVCDYVVRKYGDRKARAFLNGADPFVLAHAMAMGKNGIVVSHESTREQHSIIKIPTVCYALKIQPVSLFQMLNKLNARY